MAAFTPVDFRSLAEFLKRLFLVRCTVQSPGFIIEPALEVSDTQLPFGVFFITGPLSRHLGFDFEWHPLDLSECDAPQLARPELIGRLAQIQAWFNRASKALFWSNIFLGYDPVD